MGRDHSGWLLGLSGCQHTLVWWLFLAVEGFRLGCAIPESEVKPDGAGLLLHFSRKDLGLFCLQKSPCLKLLSTKCLVSMLQTGAVLVFSVDTFTG